MGNNLSKVENNLRSIAKRYKNVKYSLGLAILFLMMGVSAFSEEVNNAQAEAVPTREEIASSRENLKNSVGSLQSKINQAKAENEKGLAGLKLELIQLMEQGDQVVKSPWSSWQFGANYMYSKWNDTYKGKEDKSEKYPYEGLFTRSTNAFVRSANIQNKEQLATFRKLLSDLGETKSNGVSALNTEAANNGKKYGLRERNLIEEQPYTIQVSAAIRPRNIVKTDVQLNVTFNEITAPKPGAELSAPSTPIAPNISIPSFAPVAPKVEPPVLPTPPTFAVVLGADCNTACNSKNTTPRQLTKEHFTDTTNNNNNPSKQNERLILHYTWSENQLAEKGYAFKMYYEDGWIRGITRDSAFKPNNPEATDKGDTNNNIYFNSYNFDWKGPKEFQNPIVNSQGEDRNHQYFLIGGSRFREIDNQRGHNPFTFGEGRRVNLGGILTLGIVSQENGAKIINQGTITDEEEKDEKWIKDMHNYYDAGKDFMTIKGPSEAIYEVKRSKDGYVGYKVGIAQVEENSRNGYDGKDYNITNQDLENGEKGKLIFYGERSIGMYIYLPRAIGATGNFGNFKASEYYLAQTYATLVNKGEISLSGKESYGMKIAANSDSRVVMHNSQGATINLRKNPNGEDKADNSAAMALMTDDSVRNMVSLDKDKAVNEGTINLKDNISNSLGMFVNIDSNMTNKGTINISAEAQKGADGKYKYNIGMRADQVISKYATKSANFDTTVINRKNINITGKGAIAMVANRKETTGPMGKGIATAVNEAGAKIDIGGKDNYGMLATNEAKIVNNGDINITNSPNSIGMSSLGNGTNYSIAENTGNIKVTGANSTAVYNRGKFTMTSGTVDGSGKQSIGIYARGNETAVSTEIKGGKITVKDQAVGLYSDLSKITLDNSSNNLELIADNGGLLFYNYQSDNSDLDTGKFLLKGNVEAQVKAGGYGFYLKNAEITTTGEITGVSGFLNRMFTRNTGAGKLKVKVEENGTFMILHKPRNGKITLSSVATPQNINNSLGQNVELVPPASGRYKVYSVYRGHLRINQNVILDNDNTTSNPDAIYRVDFRSSSEELDAGKTISGTKQGQIAMFQGNYDEGAEKGTVTEINITNNGKISLSSNSGAKTTTAMAGDFVTLTNNKDVEVTGDKAVGMFGAGGSKVLNNTNGTITVGKEGVALYGANKLGNSTLGDKTISLVNKGKITAVSGKESPYGIYTKNDLSLATRANARVTNEGTIDFTSAKKSIGAYVEDATLTNTGKMLVGEEGVGIFSKNSDVTSSGDITLTKKAIAFNLDGTFTGRTLNFTSKITLTDDDNTIFNFKNATFDTTGLTGFTDNLNIVSNNKSYSYFSLKDSTLTYNRDKTFTGKNVKFVNANTSKVDWRSNLTLNGNSNVAFYANGTSGAGPEVKIASGKTITLAGDKTVGVYSAGGARVQNAGNIVVGSNGAALYSKDTGTLTNTGKLTLGKNSAGIYLAEGAGSLSHSGAGLIESTAEGAKGIVVKSSSAGNFANNAKIKLTGASSIGVYSTGNARTFSNNGDIEVGNTTNFNQSVGIYMLNSGIVKNYKSVKAGNKSIGIYGKDISLESANSTVEVGDGATGIY